jgi:hypothetical protein
MIKIDEKNYDILLKILDLATQLNKTDVKKFYDYLYEQRNKPYNSHLLDDQLYIDHIYPQKNKGKLNKDKKELIGNLPFILMESKYFSTNQDIVNLAVRLNIPIPKNWAKRSKEEIIGRIIVNVSNLEKNKISQLNMILNQILKKVEDGTLKDDFFLEWDRTIKNMT